MIPFEPLTVDSADLTGNGAPDIVVSSVNSEEIAIFANAGSGAIELTTTIERPLDGAILRQPITRLALGKYQDGGGPINLLVFRLNGKELPGLNSGVESVVGELRMLTSTCPIKLSLDVLPDPVAAGRDVSLRIAARNVSGSTTMAGVRVSLNPNGEVAPTSVDAPSVDACELRSPEFNASLLCDVGTLGPGERFESTLHGTVASSLASPLEVRSDVAASLLGHFYHDVRTRTVYGSDVRAELQIDPTAVVFGQSLRMTAIVNNVGTEAAGETAFEVELDDALEFAAAPGCVHSGEPVGGIVTCMGEPLDPLRQFARAIDIQVIPDPAPRPRALAVGALMSITAPSIDADTFARDNLATASVPVALAGVQPRNFGFESDRLDDWVVSPPGAPASLQQFSRVLSNTR